jgi:glutathionyl-hydroquinone reductase
MGLLIEGEWRDQWYDTKSTGGAFMRQEAQFRNWVTPDGAPGPTGEGGFAAESGRYHLYVSHACPWANRTMVFRSLKGLEDHIGVSVVHPDMLGDGWTFEPISTAPPATGCSARTIHARDISARRPQGVDARHGAGPVGHENRAHRVERKRRDHPHVQLRLRRDHRQHARFPPGGLA